MGLRKTKKAWHLPGFFVVNFTQDGFIHLYALNFVLVYFKID